MDKHTHTQTHTHTHTHTHMYKHTHSHTQALAQSLCLGFNRKGMWLMCRSTCRFCRTCERKQRRSCWCFHSTQQSSLPVAAMTLSERLFRSAKLRRQAPRCACVCVCLVHELFCLCICGWSRSVCLAAFRAFGSCTCGCSSLLTFPLVCHTHNPSFHRPLGCVRPCRSKPHWRSPSPRATRRVPFTSPQTAPRRPPLRMMVRWCSVVTADV